MSNFARTMAGTYALDLKQRLEKLQKLQEQSKKYEACPPMTDTPHLIWMCDQIIQKAEFSETKAHRWIGYIQGVMTMRGLSSVEHERTRYVEVKKELAHDLGADDQSV
jgi:hypothetical protein